MAEGFGYGAAGTGVTEHSDLCHDAEGNLFGRAAAQVQANRSAHAHEFFGGDTFFVEELENSPDTPLAADHAYIRSGRVDDSAETLHIVRVGARDQDNMGARCNRIVTQYCLDIAYQ